MRIRKRIGTSFLAMAMVLSLVPAPSLPDENTVDSGGTDAAAQYQDLANVAEPSETGQPDTSEMQAPEDDNNLELPDEPSTAVATPSEETASAETAITSEESVPTVTYCVHGQTYGWQSPVTGSATAGTTGQGKRLEAMRISVYGINAQVQYRVHVQRKGWQPWVTSNAVAGTVGQGLRLEALEIKLAGTDTDLYDIEYRVHVQGIGWQPWVRNGTTAGTTGQARRIEAVEMRLTNRPAVRVSYTAHVQSVGWQLETADGAIAGTTGRSLRMEALRARLTCGRGVSGGISYKVHAQGIGWMKDVFNGAVAGTTGQGRQLEALTMNLTGAVANDYDIWYRAHVQKVGWTAWGANGAQVGSTGLGLRMESLQVKILPRGAQPPANGGAGTGLTCPGLGSVRYKAYVQGSGWQAERADGAVAGTTGKALRVEGIGVRVVGQGVEGVIQYRVHMQKSGWLGWQQNGGPAGNVDSGLRMEAVQMRLTGILQKTCDVWYRVHVQGIGWMGWAANGASAGTTGQARRIESIQVKLLRKGSAAPGPTANSYQPSHRLVLIGDSRTAAMYDMLYGGDHYDVNTVDSSGIVWSARVGAGYSWMTSGGVSRVESRIGSNTSVVILLGVNDVLNGARSWNSYIAYINAKAAAWTARGTHVYYGAISPVGYHTGIDSVTDRYGTTSNSGNVAAWNNAMRRGLSSNVRYLDTYNAIASNYTTSDGVHYDNATSHRLFNYIRSNTP